MGSCSGVRRGKTVIKEVEQINRRYVTFSKRKLGLFNKLTELSILCNVESALIITSQNGKHYSCGYPDVDTVIGRYLGGGPPQRRNPVSKKEVEKLRVEYEALQIQLKEEQKRLQDTKERQKGSFWSPPWWNVPTEDMGLENLLEFKNSLELLKYNLVGALQEKDINSVPSSTMLPPPPITPPAPAPAFPHYYR
ncbi:hypothetical protein VNO78_24961 [Psophocarpus tetragonolobus]|uniref:MADS-box domain-containing protein n=1 Tax=Psophocarpus tetragonolobus TaxID=3891 RepID=A0AAN9XEM6_PSOTE